MAYAPLTELDDWHLVHSAQDIRGWSVVDASGASISTVDELLVDTESQLVEAVRLNNGEEVPAADVEIGDHIVYVRGQRPAVIETTEPVAQFYKDTRIHRRESTPITGVEASTARTSEATLAGTSGTMGGTTGTPGLSTHHEVATSPTYPTGFNELHDDIRGHHQTMYGETGREYTFYEPAYLFGYRCAMDNRYAGRDFTDVESDVMTHYEREHGSGSWDAVHDAVRHGYSRGLGYSATRND